MILVVEGSTRAVAFWDQSFLFLFIKILRNIIYQIQTGFYRTHSCLRNPKLATCGSKKNGRKLKKSKLDLRCPTDLQVAPFKIWPIKVSKSKLSYQSEYSIAVQAERRTQPKI